VARGIDPYQRVDDLGHVLVSEDLGKLIGPRLGAPECLSDRDRAVDQLGVGRYQRDRHPIAGQRAQSEQTFQRGNAAAGDQHSQGVSPLGVIRRPAR
jgi:hypothetical protein